MDPNDAISIYDEDGELGGRFSVLKPACNANATTGYLTRFLYDAQWKSFPSFCQRCYSSLTELLTEVGHYTEAIKGIHYWESYGSR